MSKIGRISISCLIATSATNPIACAQYVYNPASADEAPGIRYFGSAKDDKGALLPNVSIRITSEKVTYVLVTDAQGRFRENLGLDSVPDKVTVVCFKEGYQLVRLNKRLGPSAPKQTVQVDCTLHAVRPNVPEP
jgi:hypothetical protein